MSANIPNDPVAIQRFFTSRDNNANAATYVGQEQRLWYDPVTNAIYVSDGNTAGGILVGGGGSGNGVPGGPTNSVQYNAGSGTFGGTSNIVISGNGVSVVGNVTTATFFIGDGSQLTNLPIGNYSNANVANFLPTYSGNITANFISATGNVTGNYVIASGGNTVINSGVSTTGNITGNYILGNGASLTGIISSYGNSNVAAYLPTDTTIINIQNSIANTDGNVANLTLIVANNSANITTLQGLVYSNANVANYLPVYSGNISGGNIGVSGAINAVGEITSFANIVVSAGGYFQGDGSQLTNLPIQPGTYGNSNVANYLPTNTTIININSNVANTDGNVANLTTALGNTNSNVANLTLVVANNSANITTLQNQVYSNANVAAYLPTYSGNITANYISTTGDVIASNGNTVIDDGVSTTGNVTGANIVTVGNVTANNFLGNSYLYANGNSIFANIQLTGNIDLGNLYIIDETIYGRNTNQDIILSPAGNTAYVDVPRLKVAVGSMIQGQAQVNPIIASLILNQVIANSTGPGNTLPAGSYGNPEGVAAPWAVYEFTTVPSPVLQVNDVIAGTGVPVPSTVQWVGNTSGTDSANANVVVTTGSYSDLPTPIPTTGNVITVTRSIELAGLDIVSAANTTINLLPGTAGNVIIGSSMLPAVNNAFDLGSPTARWRSIYFGGNTIYVYDPVLGVDQSIAAYNGNLVVGGGTGLSVGEFTLFGNTIAIANPAEDIYFGTNIATGNVNFRRPLQVLSNVAYSQPTFQVDRNGLTTINVSSNLPNTVAALNVNGANSGNSYPRNFSATLVQLTNLDNEPARLSADAFGANTSTGQNAYFAIAGRAARGTVDAPGQTLAGDTLTRVTSQAFNNAGAFQGSIVRYNQVATGNVTTTSAGTRHNFQATPTGSVVIKNIANIDAVGLTLTSFANSGPANTGITFQDGSFQDTAYIPANTVTSITAATGIAVTAATGDITITNTGVITAQGTANQIAVNGSYANTASGNIILTLPQDISASSNPTFNNITAGNINVLGNLTYSNVDTLDSYRLYLANTSTISSQINGGGIILGNVADGTYWRSILYDQTTDAWSVQGTYGAGNLIAGNVYSQASNVASQVVRNDLHIGEANQILDYPNALVQADTDTLGYAQIVFQNHGNSGDASTDYVAVNDQGTDSQNYIDFGINSSTYANTDYAVTGANDGYLYVNGGNLAIGTQSPANVINFFTGGTNVATNIRAVLSDTDLAMKNANVLVQDGNDNSIIELRTDGNIAFNGSATLNLTGGFHVSSVSTNAGDANIVNYVGGAFVYGPALKDYAGNLRANFFTATGNVTGGNLITSGLITATGNVTGGNIRTVGLISATGNVTGNYFVGNGSQLTGLVAPVNADWTSTSGLSQILHKTGASGPTTIALGQNAAGNVQGTGAIAIGVGAAGSATTSQGADAIAIGTNAGGALNQAQGDAAIAIGKNAGGAGYGTDGQKQWSVAIGNEAGTSNQEAFSVAVGAYAGRYNQGQYSTALGQAAGLQSQGNGAVAIGQAGYESQGQYAVAIGSGAGDTNQGINSIAIGYQAGTNNQTANSIILNASGSALETSGVAGLFINPVRNNLTSNANPIFFNTSTKELTYANTISLPGNVSGGNIRTTGLISATANITGGNILTGGLISSTGNITGGNIATAGLITATGNVQSGNIRTAGLVSATGNIIGAYGVFSNGNTVINAGISTTGNITGNYFIGNGSQLTNVNIGVGGNQLVYALNAQQTIGSAKNTLLSLFGLTNGVALASNTRYQYEILFNSQCSKAGVLSYALALSGGTVVAQHNYNVISNKTTGSTDAYTAGITMMSLNATGAAITTAQTVADTATFTHTIIQGTIDVTTGGNVNFMVSQDQNTPVTWTINAGSYVKLLPLGPIGANTVDGTWS